METNILTTPIVLFIVCTLFSALITLITNKQSIEKVGGLINLAEVGVFLFTFIYLITYLSSYIY